MARPLRPRSGGDIDGEIRGAHLGRGVFVFVSPALPQEKMVRDQLVFYLNGKRVELNDAEPELTLIQFVRSVGRP